ncbi:MAG TPA: c-type cytochrome, partial [Vicinamibacterales bacterium]
MARRLFTVLAAVPFVVSAAAQSPSTDGKSLFDRECATCHTGESGSRAPAREVLRERSPEAILFALTAGGMRPFGAHLSGAERRAAATVIPGVVFSGSNDGALRAFSTKDGAIIWEYDTNRTFDTVNGVPAR